MTAEQHIIVCHLIRCHINHNVIFSQFANFETRQMAPRRQGASCSGHTSTTKEHHPSADKRGCRKSMELQRAAEDDHMKRLLRYVRNRDASSPSVLRPTLMSSTEDIIGDQGIDIKRLVKYDSVVDG